VAPSGNVIDPRTRGARMLSFGFICANKSPEIRNSVELILAGNLVREAAALDGAGSDTTQTGVSV